MVCNAVENAREKIALSYPQTPHCTRTKRCSLFLLVSIAACTGAVYQCIIHPCSTTKCPMHPTATCIGNFCNGCNAHFYLNGNNVTSTCQPKTTTVAVASKNKHVCVCVCVCVCVRARARAL